MINIAKFRLAGLLGVGLLAAGGEWFYGRVAENPHAAENMLILALVSLVVVDQLILLFGKHPEDILEALERLRKDVVKPAEDALFTQKWSQMKLYSLLSQVSHGADIKAKEEGDVRILTTFFIDFEELTPWLEKLLKNGVHFKILLANPENEALIRSRFEIRKDGNTPEEARRTLEKQIRILTALPGSLDDCTGSLVVKVSDLMPCGFVVQSRSWMLCGMMPCEWSYVIGPMIKVEPGMEMWKMLTDDWKSRWAVAKAPRT